MATPGPFEERTIAPVEALVAAARPYLEPHIRRRIGEYAARHSAVKRFVIARLLNPRVVEHTIISEVDAIVTTWLDVLIEATERNLGILAPVDSAMLPYRDSRAMSLLLEDRASGAAYATMSDVREAFTEWRCGLPEHQLLPPGLEALIRTEAGRG